MNYHMCAMRELHIIVTSLHGCCNYFVGSTHISILMDSLTYKICTVTSSTCMLHHHVINDDVTVNSYTIE